MDLRSDPRLRAPPAAWTARQVIAGVVAIRNAPEPDAEMVTQALGGEVVRSFHEQAEFSLVQLETDGYVGWALSEALSAPPITPTHRVSALRTYAFSEASIKSAPLFLLSLNARIAADGEEGRFIRTAQMGYIAREHVVPVDAPWPDDPAAIAGRFLEAPYLWGGRESLGLDCSGLVQTAFAACGVSLPRDTDMQFALAGAPVPDWDQPGALRRGDLVFWKGHVGMMLDADRLIHANAHHLCVAIEPLAEAIARIAAAGSPVLGARRIAIPTRAARAVTPSWLGAVLNPPGA